LLHTIAIVMWAVWIAEEVKNAYCDYYSVQLS